MIGNLGAEKRWGAAWMGLTLGSRASDRGDPNHPNLQRVVDMHAL